MSTTCDSAQALEKHGEDSPLSASFDCQQIWQALTQTIKPVTQRYLDCIINIKETGLVAYGDLPLDFPPASH